MVKMYVLNVVALVKTVICRAVFCRYSAWFT